MIPSRRALLSALTLALLAWTVPFPAQAQHHGVILSGPPLRGEIIVRQAPPPPREEVIIGTQPSPRHVWVPGHWFWQGAWVWEPGYWRLAPRHGVVWVPDHWDQRGPNWIWVRGYWR